MGWWVLVAIVVLVVLWLVFTYNGLISARNRTQEAWSEIDVELKRRHDLIPNLINTVSGYMGHERGTLEAVTNALAGAVAPGFLRDAAKDIAPVDTAWPPPRNLLPGLDVHADGS